MRPTLLALPLALFAACSGGHESNANTKPDAANTGVNERDRNGGTLTPMDQSNAQDDLDHLATIRKAITSDDQLSTTAKNVKVFTRSGAVTLRGPVPTALERARIEEIADAASATTTIDNQIEVQPK